MKQSEAMRLANELDAYHTAPHHKQAAAELRRLHSVNAELLEALKWMIANDDTNEGDEPVDRLGGQSWNEYNSYWIDGLNKAREAIAKATGENT
jgi:hypothetical protein